DRRCSIGRPECDANLGTTPARLARPVVHVLVREGHAVEGAERPALRSRSRRSAVCSASSGSRAILALIVGSPALKASSAASVRADSGNLALAHCLARLDQRQTHERRGALPRRRHGVRSFVSCSAASKLDGSSSNASCPRARSNPCIAAANSRAKLWPTAFGGPIPHPNLACSP